VPTAPTAVTAAHHGLRRHRPSGGVRRRTTGRWAP